MANVPESKEKRVLAMDCDGVLVDWNLGMVNLYKILTGEYPKIINEKIFKAHRAYDLTHHKFQEHYSDILANDPLFWAYLPLFPHTLSAFLNLRSIFDEIHIVSALPAKFCEARKHGLALQGIRVDSVISAGRKSDPNSPMKADVVRQLGAKAFIEDLDAQMEPLYNDAVHLIHIDRDYADIPNLDHLGDRVVRVKGLYPASVYLQKAFPSSVV